MKNILFITWDGPQTSYMEGLFMPIFQKISERENIRFHVMQFTWADENRTASIQNVAEKMGIHYTTEKVYRKPVASLGSFLTIQSGEIPAQKGVVIYNPVSVPKLYERPKFSKFNIVYVGRLEKVKNVESLVLCCSCHLYCPLLANIWNAI